MAQREEIAMDRFAVEGGFPEPPELLPSDDHEPSDQGSVTSPNYDPQTTNGTELKAAPAPAAPSASYITLPTAALREHPDCGIVPAMSEAEYSSFLEDVRQFGIREPLAILPTKIILDGRTRHRAATEIGLPAVPCRVVDLPAGASAAEWMVVSAAQRRHLTVGQRACMAVELGAYLETRKAAATRQAATRISNGKTPKSGTTEADVDPPPNGQKSRDLAAKLAGVSPRSVQDVIRVKNEASELIARIFSGALSPNAAIAQLKRRVGATGAGANEKSSSGKVAVSPSRSKDAQEPVEIRLADAVAQMRKVIVAARKILKSDTDALGTASDVTRLVRVLEGVRTDVDELVDLIKARRHGRKGAGGKKTKVTRKGRAGR
jgi:hypothetical protein